MPLGLNGHEVHLVNFSLSGQVSAMASIPSPHAALLALPRTTKKPTNRQIPIYPCRAILAYDPIILLSIYFFKNS